MGHVPWSLRCSKRATLACVITLTLASLGCESPQVASPEHKAFSVPHTEVDILPSITSELRSSLRSDGRFPGGEIPSGASPTISAEEALGLAEEFLRGQGQYVHRQLERQHGARIDLGQLVADPRVLVAQTPYEVVHPPLSNPSRKHLGSYYLVTFEQHGVPAVLLAVSALATDIEIVDGAPHYHGDEGMRGNEFRWTGIPRGGHGIPLSPERAARMAADATGAKISAPPSFHRRGANYAPYLGFWRLQLSRPTTLATRSGGSAGPVESILLDESGVLHMELGASDGVVESHPIWVRTAAGARLLVDAMLRNRAHRVPIQPGEGGS